MSRQKAHEGNKFLDPTERKISTRMSLLLHLRSMSHILRVYFMCWIKYGVPLNEEHMVEHILDQIMLPKKVQDSNQYMYVFTLIHICQGVHVPVWWLR